MSKPVVWVCPNNGVTVRCKVCFRVVAHRFEVLADRAPECPTHRVELVRAA